MKMLGRLEGFRRATGSQLLAKLLGDQKRTTHEIKIAAKNKAAKKRASYHGSGSGPKECSRRIQQRLYDTGHATRRAITDLDYYR